MLKTINYDQIKKYKLYIPFDINTNSRLYYDKKEIHKIPFYPKYDLEKTLNYINDLDLNSIIKLTNLIYNEDKLKGYSFINYKDYKSLNRNKYRDLNLKIKDCHKILNIFKQLTDNGLNQKDISLSNILLNKKTNDIKLADLDSIYMEDKNKFEIEQLKNAAILCLMYLYNLCYTDINIITNHDCNINKDGIIIQYFRDLKNKKTVDFNEVLENMDLELIDEDKRKIKSKVKELKDTGYYNKYYF